MMTLSKCLFLEQAVDFYVESCLLNPSPSLFSVQEIPQDRVLASSYSVKPKDDPIQQAPNPKGKDKDDGEYELPGNRSVATPHPQSHMEGSGSSRDPLSTPNGMVSFFLTYRRHGSAPDGSSPRGYD